MDSGNLEPLYKVPVVVMSAAWGPLVVQDSNQPLNLKSETLCLEYRIEQREGMTLSTALGCSVKVSRTKLPLQGNHALLGAYTYIYIYIYIYSPPCLDRIWGTWGSYSNIPKAIFYLLKGGYISTLPQLH